MKSFSGFVLPDVKDYAVLLVNDFTRVCECVCVCLHCIFVFSVNLEAGNTAFKLGFILKLV